MAKPHAPYSTRAYLYPLPLELVRCSDLPDAEKLKALLKPYPADEMEMYRVSTAVNSPKQDLPEYIEPV